MVYKGHITDLCRIKLTLYYFHLIFALYSAQHRCLVRQKVNSYNKKIHLNVVLQGQSNGETIRGEFIVIHFTSKLNVSFRDPVNGV